MCLEILYSIQKDLVLNNLQWLISQWIQPNQIINIIFELIVFVIK